MNLTWNWKLARFGFSVLVVAVAQLYTLYFVNPVKGMGPFPRGLVIVVLASLQPIVNLLLNHIPLEQLAWRQSQTISKLRGQKSSSQKALSELQSVMVAFLEHSELFRDKVRDHLKLNEDYVCIVKSSEGLSGVFNEMEKKERLPFTNVLASYPGAIQPFERITLFLIPTKSLPGLDGRPLRDYISRKIIPLVEQERTKFLGKQTKAISSMADDFSYKYIAFYLRRDAIAHEVRNRKFNHAFNVFMIGAQQGQGFDNIKAELSQVVKARDIFLLVSWNSFATLNKLQRELVEASKIKINLALSRRGILKLTDLEHVEIDEFSDLFWSSLSQAQRKKTTTKKVRNLSEKVIVGARRTLDILRRNGVRI